MGLLSFKILKIRYNISMCIYVTWHIESAIEILFSLLKGDLEFHLQRFRNYWFGGKESFSLKIREKKWVECLHFVWCVLKIWSKGKSPLPSSVRACQASVVSDSLQHYGIKALHAPLSMGIFHTGMDCHALLQGIFPTQGSNLFCLLLWQAGSSSKATWK